jgi:hypothetical protein
VILTCISLLRLLRVLVELVLLTGIACLNKERYYYGCTFA